MIQHVCAKVSTGWRTRRAPSTTIGLKEIVAENFSNELHPPQLETQSEFLSLCLGKKLRKLKN